MKPILRSKFALVLVGILASIVNQSEAAGPIEVSSDPQLFVDSHLIESLRDAALRMHPPTPREVVFRFDAPWEGSECGYVTVLKDGGRFRMYYRGGGESTEEVTCLAEGIDGVLWERPDFGLFDFKGSKHNNIIFRGTTKAYSESHNFTPFIDLNPSAKSEERYKAVAFIKYQDETGKKHRALGGLASPDGIHWKRSREEPILIDGGFDSQNIAFWDTVQRQYVCFFREGRNGFRSVRRSVSPDFLHWSTPEWIDLGNSPSEQFYTSAIAPYFRNRNLYLGFPMRFVPERREIGAEGRKVDALSDGVMISSHDGLHFNRQFMEAFIRPGLDPQNWGDGHGNNTPAWGLLPTARGEMSLYWTEHYGADYSSKTGRMEPDRSPQLRRGSLRVDGLASVNAGYAGGELVTKPLLLKGKRLLLNCSTSAIGSIRVEIQDAAGTALPGFAISDTKEIYGDELDRAVVWKDTDLAQLAGRPVKLKFLLKDADLYSFRLEP